MAGYLDIVRAQIAEQHRDFNNDGSTDSVWTEIQSNVFHIADQFLIAGKFDKSGAERIISVYNDEIIKLNGPKVELNDIWPNL